MGRFKAQTLGIEGGGGGGGGGGGEGWICNRFWSFLKMEKPSLRVETP